MCLGSWSKAVIASLVPSPQKTIMSTVPLSVSGKVNWSSLDTPVLLVSTVNVKGFRFTKDVNSASS